MNYSTLEEVYGTPFGQRVPVTRERKDIKEQPMPQKTQDMKEVVNSVMNSLPLDKNPETETFRVEQPVRKMGREKFTQAQPAAVVDISEQSEKLSRILRLIEQNRTGYERPAIQDMLLYIFTGVVFLFTFDTFVLLGKSMRKN